MTWDTCSTSWCWEVTNGCCSSNSRAGLTLLVTALELATKWAVCVLVCSCGGLSLHRLVGRHTDRLLGILDKSSLLDGRSWNGYVTRLDIRRCLPRPSRGQHGTIVTRNGQAGHVQLWTAKQRQDLFLETGQDLLGNGTSHRVLDGHDRMRPSGTEW